MPTAKAPLDLAYREVGSRVVAALAARYRDLDLAEEGYAEALSRAAARWGDTPPGNPAAWLYRTADRAILDLLRRRAVRARHAGDAGLLLDQAEDTEVIDRDALIPDERLRLIFVCCHPSLADDARVALTLKVVCGLSTGEIARAFLQPEPTIAQRLVRSKRKIAEAGVPFEVPGPRLWAERLSAVLSTVEIAYSKAHEDSAGSGEHAGFGPEMLGLIAMLAELLPQEADVLALAATIHFAEGRRPARVDAQGTMVPLSEQDPAHWNRGLVETGHSYLRRGFALQAASRHLLQAAIHAAWCQRRALSDPPPWPKVLALYDGLLNLRDDPFVRLNRAVALSEVRGAQAALEEVDALGSRRLADYLPYHALRADLLLRTGRLAEAATAYDTALALQPGRAEAAWLSRARERCAVGG